MWHYSLAVRLLYQEYPKHHGHDQAGFEMALDFCKRLRLPPRPGGCEPDQWRVAVNIAAMSAVELGIDLDQLEEIKPKNRADMLLQARIGKLRGVTTPNPLLEWKEGAF